MKENKIYCDHCGKEIDPMRDYDDLQIDMGHKWYNTDLCIECLDKLYDIVINFCKKLDHPTEKGSLTDTNVGNITEKGGAEE